jgi:hypothetical protein
MFTLSGGSDRQPNLENLYLSVDTLRMMENGKVLSEDKHMEGECHFNLNSEATKFFYIKCDVYDRAKGFGPKFYLENISTFKRLIPPESAGASASVTETTPGEMGKRIALVIGNSDYRNVPVLPNPKNDASTIADALKQDGFDDVTLVFDLDEAKMRAALGAFSEKATNADWAVIYFSGHGLEAAGTNYLVPVDATLLSDRRVRFEAIPLDDAISEQYKARKCLGWLS